MILGNRAGKKLRCGELPEKSLLIWAANRRFYPMRQQAELQENILCKLFVCCIGILLMLSGIYDIIILSAMKARGTPPGR